MSVVISVCIGIVVIVAFVAINPQPRNRIQARKEIGDSAETRRSLLSHAALLHHHGPKGFRV